MKKLLFVINPCSGKGKIKNRLLEILDIFVKQGYRVETYITQKPLDGKEKVISRGRSADLIVCSGWATSLPDLPTTTRPAWACPNR